MKIIIKKPIFMTSNLVFENWYLIQASPAFFPSEMSVNFNDKCIKYLNTSRLMSSSQIM